MSCFPLWLRSLFTSCMDKAPSRKSHGLLQLCSAQSSTSLWPHVKTQCVSRHLSLFPFLQGTESLALRAQVICTDTYPSENARMADFVPPPVFQGIAHLTVNFAVNMDRMEMASVATGKFQHSHPFIVAHWLKAQSPLRSLTFWQYHFTQVPWELCVLLLASL